MGTLAEGIKEMFATAKTTGSNVMLCGNDGTPDGHMTLANLASVLGESYNIVALQNIDNITTPGIYYLNGTSSSQQDTDDSILFVYFAQPKDVTEERITIQERIAKGDFAGKIIRHKYGSNSWTSWQHISVDMPTFYKNYSDLASLASALGVLKAYGNSDFTGDLNTIMGNYYLRVSPFATNNPTGYYAQLISIGGSIGGSRIGVFQICFQYQLRSDIYVRAYSDDTWNAWKKITLTSIS